MRTGNLPNTDSPSAGHHFSRSAWGPDDAHVIDGLNISICNHCLKGSMWLLKRLLIPAQSNAEPAHDDMPEKVKEMYDEAAEIADASPRGAAALLRVALELLTHELGCDPNKSINSNIADLINNGLAPDVVKALDILRVTGNNAAHPSGALLLDDDGDTATGLFQTINYVVEQAIAHKRRLEEMHDRLPEGIKRAIEQRDLKAAPKAE